jgi:predicted RecB family endonuclease
LDGQVVHNPPEPVYRRLKKSARQLGRNLNAQVIQILRDHAADQDRFDDMAHSEQELERFVSSLAPMRDSTPLIRQDRRRDK